MNNHYSKVEEGEKTGFEFCFEKEHNEGTSASDVFSGREFQAVGAKHGNVRLPLVLCSKYA